MYKKTLKRFIDVFASLTGLLLLSPILLIITAVLYYKNNGEVLFVQDRPGKDAKIFKVMKFMSMSNAKDEHGNLLPDELRITKMGKFLRTSSLDEIPQLINILKGDMSLIGPRPLLVKYLPLYSKEQLKRHLVRPGITGLAQVNGRNNISWEHKFQLDVQYVENLSLLLDIKIFLLTIKKIIIREGISKDGHATTETFTGNQ